MGESAPVNSVFNGPKHGQYWRGQVWGRRSKLVKDRSLWLALVVGTILTASSRHLPVVDMHISDLSSAALTYASIAFGACITSLVLAVGLFPIERVKTWSTQGEAGSQFSHFSDLVFVFTWSATAQLAVIAFGLGGFFFGADITVVPDSPRLSHWLLLYASCVTLLYAFLQLFTVVSTLSQMAWVTITETQKAKET